MTTDGAMSGVQNSSNAMIRKHDGVCDAHVNKAPMNPHCATESRWDQEVMRATVHCANSKADAGGTRGNDGRKDTTGSNKGVPGIWLVANSIQYDRCAAIITNTHRTYPVRQQ